MLDLLRKSFFAGLGAVVVTADKVRDATRKLVEEGKISTDEAERLTEDLVKSGQRQWDEFQSSMRKWSENADIARMKDVQDLQARVELLEQRIRLLEDTHRVELDQARKCCQTPAS